VFSGTANYEGTTMGSPSIVEGPGGEMDGILFTGTSDYLQLGDGVDTDTSWTIDCEFKTPIPPTVSWHTLTRGAVSDHQVIITNGDQKSLGSFDNAGNSGFTDTGFDATSLADGWHRLTVAAGSGAATFYIDGQEIGSHTTVSESDFYAVGNYQGGGQQWGYLSRFRIYDGTHTPSQLVSTGALSLPPSNDQREILTMTVARNVSCQTLAQIVGQLLLLKFRRLYNVPLCTRYSAHTKLMLHHACRQHRVVLAKMDGNLPMSRQTSVSHIVVIPTMMLEEIGVSSWMKLAKVQNGDIAMTAWIRQTAHALATSRWHMQA
jgi:hypothetical protein